MTLVPNSVLYGAIAHARQARFEAQAAASRRRAAEPMRVRIGRTLIGVGMSISGDSIELRPRRTARRPHAA